MLKTEIQYGNNPRQKADLYQSGNPKALIVFLHGGSWKSGDKQRYPFIARTFTGVGYDVFIPNYRLFPEVRFPVFLEDVVTSIKSLSETEATDTSKIILMGHSAGAHMAALLAHDSKYLLSAGLDRNLIKGFIGISGAYDFYPRPDLRPIFDLSDPAKPWKPIKNIHESKVPSLLVHGRLDVVVSAENARNYAAALESAGVQTEVKIYSWLEHMGTLASLHPRLYWLSGVRKDILAQLENII